MLAGHGQHLLDAVDDPLEPLPAVDLRIALPAEHAADRAGPPSRRVTRIISASRSTARLRPSGSGLVKSGEQQSIGMAKPASWIASPTRSR